MFSYWFGVLYIELRSAQLNKIEEQRIAKEKLLTQERLKQLLDYDAETGKMHWKTGARAGAEAGGIGALGYRVIRVLDKVFKAHRLAWLYVYGVWPGPVIDHIDRDKLNNRISNLRDTTVSENTLNGGMSPRNSSGWSNVSFENGPQLFAVNFRFRGEKHHIGRFKTIDEARAVAALIPSLQDRLRRNEPVSTGLRSSNNSGVANVNWHKKKSLFCAEFEMKKTKYYLGFYRDIDKAKEVAAKIPMIRRELKAEKLSEESLSLLARNRQTID